MADPLYDSLGARYARARRTDPRIAAILWGQLGDADSVLNVGAGAGSYEPPDRAVVAIEPSEVMRRQRPPGAGECLDGVAEALPFEDGSFDVVMAVCSDWFWADRGKALAEMRRVARQRVILLTLDRSVAESFWLSREYLPSAHDLWGQFEDTRGHMGPCALVKVPIPGDCLDGFFHAYWRRPEAYLDPSIRASMAVFERLDPEESSRGLQHLAEDLRAGRWNARHGDLLEMGELDLGYRLLVGDTG